MWTQPYGVYFLSVTLQAAVHLGMHKTVNLRSTKNQPNKSLRQLVASTPTSSSPLLSLPLPLLPPPPLPPLLSFSFHSLSTPTRRPLPPSPFPPSPNAPSPQMRRLPDTPPPKRPTDVSEPVTLYGLGKGEEGGEVQVLTPPSSPNRCNVTFLCVPPSLSPNRLSQAVPVQVSAGLVARVKNEFRALLQCQCLEEGRQPWIFFCQWNFRRILWSDSKKCRNRSFTSINSLHGSKKWRLLFIRGIAVLSIRFWIFPKFEMLDGKIASALNEIIQNSYYQKKVSLEEQKAQKEGRFLRGRQIAFTIYDYFRVTGAHDTVLDYPDLFSIILRSGDVQDKLVWPRSLLKMFWKVCTN